jgi:hypothetical protein
LMAALKRSLSQEAPTAKGLRLGNARRRHPIAVSGRSSAGVGRQEKERRADDRARHIRREASQEGLIALPG